MKQANQWPTTRVTLLRQIRDSRDEIAWCSFVDLYTPLIYRYCRRHRLQDADARNVVQEVFSRVSRAIRTFEYDPERGQFRSWLGLVTHQQMLRYVEKENSSVRAIGAGAGDELCNDISGEVDGAWVEAFNAHVYRTALDAIRREFDDETWNVFQQTWEAGRPPGEVARQMQRDPQWVYQAKFRVVRRLKDEIERLSADVAIFGRK